VSAERAHAAAVRAAEDQALRQVHERRRVAVASQTPAADDPRKTLRRAQRELEAVEALVAQLEAEVATVVAALEDPALYTRPDGAATARQLGTRLEALQRELENALERWTTVTERVETLSRP
jgi:pyrimidine deaminase RibD-like protein